MASGGSSGVSRRVKAVERTVAAQGQQQGVAGGQAECPGGFASRFLSGGAGDAGRQAGRSRRNGHLAHQGQPACPPAGFSRRPLPIAVLNRFPPLRSPSRRRRSCALPERASKDSARRVRSECLRHRVRHFVQPVLQLTAPQNFGDFARHTEQAQVAVMR